MNFRKSLCTTCFYLFFAGFFNTVLESAPDEEFQRLAPVNLSCELLTQPHKTVIFDPRPEFAWDCGSGEEVFQQSAYQVIVKKVLQQGQQREEVVWDSSRIESDRSINVQYEGEPLIGGESYEWTVRAWDQAKEARPWSRPQRFVMSRRLGETTSVYPLEKIETAPYEMRSLSEGDYFVDFGKDAFGYLELNFPEGTAAQTLEVRFGEKIQSGRIDTDPGGTIRYYSVKVAIPAGSDRIEVRPPQDERNTSGAAILLPESIGVIAPFRYVEILGGSPNLAAENVSRIQIEYPFDAAAASFECSDSTLNEIWELCKYSIQATTFCGVYVDGDRERIPYEADAYINQLAHYGVDREYSLARHSHEYLITNPTWPTEWKQHSILMAWADYWYTGDKESLETYYDCLKTEKLLTTAELPNGLVETSRRKFRDIVDWPENERDGFEMRPVNTVVNAFHYATLRRMADLASAIDHAADGALFERKARSLKEQFNKSLWDSSRGCYLDGLDATHSSLHANLFPLAFDLVPDERKKSVVRFVKSRKMRCSVYAAQYLVEGLYRADEDDYALQLLTSRRKRSWYNMIRSGSTITLEAWDQKFKPNLDWNHAWGAAPANLIPMFLVGVRPDAPGFKQIVVQPRPGELTSFNAKVPTVRGPVQVNYNASGESIRLDLEIPGNCTARVGVPISRISSPITLTCNETPIAFQITGKHAWIDPLPPGKYSLEASTASNGVPAAAEKTLLQ